MGSFCFFLGPFFAFAFSFGSLLRGLAFFSFSFSAQDTRTAFPWPGLSICLLCERLDVWLGCFEAKMGSISVSFFVSECFCRFFVVVDLLSWI